MPLNCNRNHLVIHTEEKLHSCSKRDLGRTQHIPFRDNAIDTYIYFYSYLSSHIYCIIYIYSCIIKYPLICGMFNRKQYATQTGGKILRVIRSQINACKHFTYFAPLVICTSVCLLLSKQLALFFHIILLKNG